MATQPPPARPWFRLPSIARPAPTTTPTPEPPPPQPRPPLARPTFRPMTQPQEPTAPAPTSADNVVSSSVPSSPVRRTSAPTSPVKPVVIAPSVPSTSPVKQVATASSVPTSLEKPVAITTSSVRRSPPLIAQPVPTTIYDGTAATRIPSPVPALRTIKPAVQTPTAPPPSPLFLPPPQLKSKVEPEPKIPAEAEQKAVLVQETIETRKAWVNSTAESHKDFREHHRHGIANDHHGKHEESKEIETKKKSPHKKLPSDTKDVGMTVITIAGENKGAFMEIIRSPFKQSSKDNPHSLNNKSSDSDRTGWLNYKSSSSGNSDEGNSKEKDKKHKGNKATHSPPEDAFTNSNVQGVNSSILFHSSCTHGDAGVHLSFTRKPSAKKFETKKHNGVNGRDSS